MSFRAEIALALALAAALGLALVAGRRPATTSALDTRVSTLVSGPRGARAVYDVLARLGRPQARRRRPLFDLGDDPRAGAALLVVLDPPHALDPAELDAVVAFVERGGAVLAAGAGGGITPCAGWRTERAAPRWGDSVSVVAPPAAWRLPLARHVLAPRRADTTEAADLPRLPGRVGAIAATHCARLAATAADTVLHLADGRPVILRLRYAGGGQVALVADAAYVANRAWRDTDAAFVVLPLLTPGALTPGALSPGALTPGASPGGLVIWDEYHQGEAQGGSLGRAVGAWLVGTPLGLGLLQLALVALVALAVAAVRFGPAQAVLERRRRSPLEHLEALAAGLEGAAGVETAVGLVAAGLRRRLGRVGHLTPADERRWLAALELAVPTPGGRQAARRLQAVISQPGGAERVLAAAHAVEDVWQELRPRATRD
jgi:hypothetical protein